MVIINIDVFCLSNHSVYRRPMQGVVALVGRPNVGKSTLFNRLIGRRTAITLRNPGITRDRLYGTATWLGNHFTLIDTGGFIPQPAAPLEEKMRHQVELAIAEAELVLLVVDAKQGLHPEDEVLARMLRKGNKSYLVVATKSDVKTAEWEHHAFHILGGEELHLVSAEHGVGFGELLESITERLGALEKPGDRKEIKILIAGRPNVGKSTLLNTLVGSERAVVDSVPGTTRDPVDTLVDVGDHLWRIVDTAGLRRRTRITENVEYYASTRLHKALARADIVLLLVDISEGLTRQDKRLAVELTKGRTDLIFVFNKIDLYDRQALKSRFDAMSYELRGLENYFQVLISGKKKRGIEELIDTVNTLMKKRNQHVPKALLADFITQTVKERPPGHRIRFYKFIQKQGAPPMFVLECNRPRNIQTAYLRFLTNRLRTFFDFTGTNLKLKVVKR
ncbi:ribosome biogenesis GTPase Der [candidate division WOR-3 bacterium]|uniref:GTPase Der n=1 Tax=candidate division WOR-3 bacterium TaxID=2052148 RepID=A0A9D5K782_UNCW3|nr:ribosome biogenesis GTPase Der [candidate division WOR-3 bacterium]MBD3363618.1 ribosome biogenesis GTPase Der [candidate division WOR-3 bacterium]